MSIFKHCMIQTQQFFELTFSFKEYFILAAEITCEDTGEYKGRDEDN